MAEKYRYTFKTLQGETCTVRFNFNGFTGASTTLTAADRPFILQEFNTDEDLFKPLRPQLATMNILADGVTMDDFLMDNDDDVIVYFDFGTFTNYWIGYLQQDDFQETWIDTNHIITLRASEGIGLLKDKQISDFGAELSGKYNFLELIERGMAGTVQTFAEYYVYSGLFHDSMANYGNGDTGLDQCYVNAKTFQINPSEYDDAYTALEKINRAWNQTLYMYDGLWYIQRLEELYTAPTNNIVGYAQTLLGRNDASRRFDIIAGKGLDAVPISPEMLRFIQRRTKKDTVRFNYKELNEIVCNGAFNMGEIISDSPLEKIYELDDWEWKTGSIGSPTTPTSGYYDRAEIYDNNRKLIDQYARVSQDSTQTRFIKSCPIELSKGESFKFSVDHKYALNFTTPFVTNIEIYIQLYGVTNNWTLDEDGKWYQSNVNWTTNIKGLRVYYNGTGGASPTEWTTTQVDSESLPEDGNLYITLWCQPVNVIAGQAKYYKNLQLDVSTSFNGYEANTIQSVESIFTKSTDLKKAFEDEIFFDDGISKIYNGCIFEDDETTLTSPNWFRRRFPADNFGFRKQNAIAHWEHNRFNRNKIDANFYGLTWDSGNKPIGLINTVIFNDDDPDKVYAIMNLKEIDFASSTWSATLEEVYDDAKDNSGTISYSFEANATPGVQSGVSFLTLQITSAAQFGLVGDFQFIYNGSTQITVNISCQVEGDITDISATPHDAYIYFKRNNDTLNSDFVTVTSTPTAFNFDLSANSVVLNPGDVLYLELDSRIEEIDIADSNVSFTYSVTGGVTYDPYEDKYIYS